MSLEYKNRGILHKLTSSAKFRPQESVNPLIKLTTKAALATETTVLFAKDLAVNRFVGKETHIKFERRQGKNGKYRTHIKLVRAEAPQQLPRGVLHKLNDIGRFFEGDKPFQKKAKIEYKPKTIKGRIAYYGIAKPLAEGTKFHLKNSVKLVKGAALASESALLKAKSAGINMLTRKLRMSSEMSDGGKSAMTMLSAVSTGRRAVRYLKTYRKKRVKYKESKQSYKNQKLTEKAAKQKLKDIRKENRPVLFKHRVKRIVIYGGNIQRFVKFHASHGKTASKSTYKRQRKVSAGKQLVLKSKIKYRKKLNATEKTLYKNQKKFQKLAKKKMKRNKVTPAPLMPVMAPSAFALKRIGRKSWEKALSADQNNDFIQAADKISRGAFAVHHAAKPIKNKLYEKRTQTQQNRLQREHNRLNEKKGDLKKDKRKHIKKNQKPIQQKITEKAKEIANKAAQQAKKAVGDFVKFAIRTFGIFLIPIIAIIIIFAMFMLTFTGVAGNSSYVLGTYNAEDRYISYAVEHYTKIAYDFNENILKCGKSDEWKKGLENLGVISSKLSSYKNTPNKYKFGKSDYFAQIPSYDFDPDKLAAFMCAYYYEPDEDGNVSNWVWNDSYDAVLQKLFDTEYEFKHHYEDYSGWKQLNDYVFFGGGGSSGEFYTIDSTDVSKSTMKTISVPTEINKFCKDGYLHYNYNTLELLDANNKDKQTGYYIQDQRFYVTDPNGHSSKPFFIKTYVDSSNVMKYSRLGAFTYLTDTSEILDEDGNKTGFYINDPSEKPLKFYKWTWKHGSDTLDRSSWSWTDDRKEICYLVSSADTKKWNSTLNNTCLVNFYRKNYWYDDCILYYTIHKKCTFEQAIISVIKSKGDETKSRLNFYYTLTQKNKNGRQTYGNHQMMNSPVLGKSLHSIGNNIYNDFGYDMQEWNKTHCSGLTDNHKGMDILANRGENVYAMFDGYIDWIDSNKQSLSLKTTDDKKIDFWYDHNNQFPVEAIYNNINATLTVGTHVRQGQIIGKVTEKKRCFDDRSISASHNYLHITVKIQYRPFVNVEVDPRFLIYRNDGEAK